ncbi:seryl-tRNA synthetase [Babesia ovis]|uniref:Serine--tRNA ligase n=1 Tax=Babesia ovis TaxID=5869 RepID=A0A9W5TCW6_BABOV|nr:seryl-tRNA synthetase [Babesia ovis]
MSTLRFFTLVLCLILPSIEVCCGYCLTSRFTLQSGYFYNKRLPISFSVKDTCVSTTKVGDSSTFIPYLNSVCSDDRHPSNCYTSTDDDLDERLNDALRHKLVRRSDITDAYIPTTFDLSALVAVPELFHANFSLRQEDHWETLLKIRSLFLERVPKEEQLALLTQRRSELAKDFQTSVGSDQQSLRESSVAIRNEIKSLEYEIKKINENIAVLVKKLPNIVSEDVPKTDILVEKTSNGSTPPETQGSFIPHYEIIERFSDTCTSSSTKISGTGFSAFSGDISRLERALANFMLDTHHKLFGYKEVSVPFVVNGSTLQATGHLPRFEDDLFKLDERHLCSGDRAYLIPTGEIPLLALLGNSRVQPHKLPLWLMTYTQCFRSEIQDYGRETRGLIRNHQFGKVELICVCDSDTSSHFHDLMLSHIEFILESLGLPYRRVVLPANQLGPTSSKTVDFEVFFPSLGKYIEVSSCSNTLDYQSNRLNLLTTSKSKVHCINGSGLAIGRTLSAILENYQSIDNNPISQRRPNTNRTTVMMLRRAFSSLSGKIVPSAKIKTQTPELQARIESELFSVMRETWMDRSVPKAQKLVTATVLTILFGGGITTTLETNPEFTLSRSIITGEIHVLSSFLAFTCGLRAGLMHYLGCGIVPRRFYWAPHYMQISSVSGVLAAAFASGNAEISPRTALQLLGGCFTLCAANETLASRFNMSPRWLPTHNLKAMGGTLLGILLLLFRESHTMPMDNYHKVTSKDDSDIDTHT